jgi:hypothetical protein
MNASRRKEIQDILNELSGLRGRIEDLQSEEQEAFGNMPEGLQQSARGQASEAAASALENAVSAIDEIDASLNEAAA